MQPIKVSVQLDTADDDGAAQNQTPSGAGDLTLNGALVTNGVAELCDAGMERQVLVTTASNESAKTITIYGTDANGQAINESMTGPNATTGTTTGYFRTITRVAVSAAFTGNVKVGTNGVGATRPVALNTYGRPEVSIQVDVSGTVNFTVQQTLDDINEVGRTSVDWFSHPDSALAAATAAAQGNYAYVPRLVRCKMNSGTGTATMTILQAG